MPMKEKLCLDSGCFTFFGFFVAVVFVFLLPLASIHAATTGLTIQPVKFSYTMTPGQSITDTVTVVNAGTSDAIVYDSVQDFLPTAGTSNIEFVGRASGVTSVIDWITINKPVSFVLPQGASEDITFTITVPRNAEPGSHFGVMFFKAVAANQPKGALQVGTQVGTLVLVTVPGNHLEKGNIVGFSTPSFIQRGPVNFDIKFQNSGTVYFEPKGVITVKNIFGKIVALVPIQGDVVLPTGERDIYITWPTQFLLGPYSAVATIYDGDGNILTTESTTFFALPIWYIVGFIVLFFVLFAIFRFLKTRLNISVSLKK